MNEDIMIQEGRNSMQRAVEHNSSKMSEVELITDMLKYRTEEILYELSNKSIPLPDKTEVGFKELNNGNSKPFQVPQIILTYNDPQTSKPAEKIVLSAKVLKDQNKHISGLDVYNETVFRSDGSNIARYCNDEIGKSDGVSDVVKSTSSFLLDEEFVNYDVQYKNQQILEDQGLMPLAERIYDKAKSLYKELNGNNINTSRLVIDIPESNGYLYPSILTVDSNTKETLQMNIDAKQLQTSGNVDITSTRIISFESQKPVEHINASSQKLNDITSHLYKTGEVSELYDLSKKINTNLKQAGRHELPNGTFGNNIYAKYVPASNKGSERIEIKGTKESNFNQSISLFETNNGNCGRQISVRATTFQNGRPLNSSYINNSNDLFQTVQNDIVRTTISQAVPKLQQGNEQFQQNQNESGNSYQQRKEQDYNRF